MWALEMEAKSPGGSKPGKTPETNDLPAEPVLAIWSHSVSAFLVRGIVACRSDGLTDEAGRGEVEKLRSCTTIRCRGCLGLPNSGCRRCVSAVVTEQVGSRAATGIPST